MEKTINDEEEDKPLGTPVRNSEGSGYAGSDRQVNTERMMTPEPEEVAGSSPRSAEGAAHSVIPDPVFRKTELRDTQPWSRSEPALRQMQLLNLRGHGTEIFSPDLRTPLRELAMAMAKRQEASGKSIDRRQTSSMTGPACRRNGSGCRPPASTAGSAAGNGCVTPGVREDCTGDSDKSLPRLPGVTDP